MKLDSKVKGGLAWTGLFVILAVPAAELLFGNEPAPTANIAVTSDTAQLKPMTPGAKPELKAPAVDKVSLNLPVAPSTDPVETYVNKGKKLPSYISDADTVPSATPAPVAVTPPAVSAPAAPAQPVDVAAINPVQETPPVPRPRSARPVASIPAVSVPTTSAAQPLIVDEAKIGAPNRAVEPFPLSDGGQDSASADDIVTSDELEEWDSGSLADYLERKGMLSEDGDSRAVFNQRPAQERRPLTDFFLF